MATIKSYTDISQSKKLAVFLPIESADMEYLSIKENGLLIGNVPFVKDDSEVEDSASSYYFNKIPCWSLAALLSILPTIDDRNAEFCKDIRCNKWHIYYHGTATLPTIDTDRYESLVDACIEMITKFHELKML